MSGDFSVQRGRLAESGGELQIMRGKLTASPLTEYTISCAYCPEFDVLHYETIKEAEKSFREEGWRIRNKLWACPKCVKNECKTTLE